MYTIQSLWTQAREALPVTTIIFASNRYAILKAEYANMGAGSTPGPQAMAMIDIAEYPQTVAIRDVRVTSDLVTLDLCGLEQAHSGFKAMLREGQFDAGELAIATCLQARAYGKASASRRCRRTVRWSREAAPAFADHGTAFPVVTGVMLSAFLFNRRFAPDEGDELACCHTQPLGNAAGAAIASGSSCRINRTSTTRSAT